MTDHSDRAEHRLAAGLTALADIPAPASRMDTAWAVRQGRSRLRRRRLGVVAAVTTVALGAAVLGTTLPDRTTAAPLETTEGPSNPVLPALGPDTGHDPLTVGATFGWLPEGFGGVSYAIGFSGAPALFSGKAYGPLQTGPNALPMNRQAVFLSVLPPGEEPTVGKDILGQQQYRVDAGPVNGRPAYWLGRGPHDPAGTGHDYRFRWQAADGNWLELQATYMRAEDGVTDIVPTIAAKVATGRQAVRLPFKVRDAPAGFTNIGTNLQMGAPAADGYPWYASLNYQSGNDYIGLDVRPDVEPAASELQPLPQADPSDDPTSVRSCVTAQGLRMCAGSAQGEAPFASTGGLAGWLDRLVPLGTDRSVWTTEVTP
ncbi:hypothetical protein ACIPYS_38320 [Kitasatospora sp. NPDC089913]|uniref:hypothetical protein n=1 Tax=Kitasatospora sp. NPDC089913 TaxID=3364080 RepID=UPI00380F0520